MPNTSPGLKNTASRRRAAPQQGQRLQNSLMRVSSALSAQEPAYSPPSRQTPEQQQTPESRYTLEHQHTARLQLAPELLYISEPVRLPEPAEAPEPKQAPQSQPAPELSYEYQPQYFYIRCRAGGPIWSPQASFTFTQSEPEQPQISGFGMFSPSAASFYVKRRPEGPIWMPAVLEAIKAIGMRFTANADRTMTETL